jgi:probable F420-dependent oxidoreductase
MDPVAVRDFAQAAEELGYEFINNSDSVLSDGPDIRHEPLVLQGYLAAVTQRMTLGTSIVIMPQRQTALVAKQLAEVDLLSGGRVRLGVGLGTSESEYTGLGADFHTRGRRLEEQVAVMRALWTQTQVTFKGKWHQLDGVGIAPLPSQRPIPVWAGGSSEPAVKRIARFADGWIPGAWTPEAAAEAIPPFVAAVKAAGRDPGDVAIQCRLRILNGTPESWVKARDGFEAAGATHLGIVINAPEYKSIDQHIKAIRGFAEAAMH